MTIRDNQVEIKVKAMWRYHLIIWPLRFIYNFISKNIAEKLSDLVLKDIRNNFDKYIKVELGEVSNAK